MPTTPVMPITLVNVVAEFVQSLRDDSRRARFLEAEFGVPVQVAPRRDDFVQERLRKVHEDRHGRRFAARPPYAVRLSTSESSRFAPRRTTLRAAARVPLCRWQKRKFDMKTIGVDLGGSHVLAAVVDEDGKIVDRAEHDIVDHAKDAVIDIVGKAIEDAIDASKGKVDGIGIGSPGNIDPDSGNVIYSPNFGWHDVPLGTELRKRFDVPVFVGNDARCATLGEYTYGTGRGTQDFVLLTLGTGIGGGIVSAGTLAVGLKAGAGEIGHHQIRATDGFYCNCGKTRMLRSAGIRHGTHPPRSRDRRVVPAQRTRARQAGEARLQIDS